MKHKNKCNEQLCRLNKYESILKKNTFLFDVSTKTMEEYADLFKKTYSLTFAPTLLSYVIWVFKRAKENNVKRLYFLARDAYPMYECAVALQKMNVIPWDLELKYLRVSRFSLRVPEYHLIKDGALDRIFLSGIDVSFRRILKRANLTDEEISLVYRQLEPEFGPDDLLNRNQILHLREETKKACDQGSCTLLSLIESHSKAAYETTMGYLEQEGLLDDVSFAVVDSGWVGTIQKSLQNLLATKKENIEVRGFYFGLYELPRDHQKCSYEAFYFYPKGFVKRKTLFSNCLFETVYSESCGMVKSYMQTKTGYEPVLSAVQNPNTEILEDARIVFQEYMKQIEAHLLNSKDVEEILSIGNVRVVEKILGCLMAHPTLWEAEVFGNCLFSDDLDDKHMRKAANELTKKEIRDLRVISKIMISLGLSKKVIHESAWIEGSIVNADEGVLLNLFFSRVAKCLTYIRQSLKQKMRN